MKTKTMKITGILLTFVMLVTMFGAFSLTASAADGDACVSTADCTGTYANGFCTVCDGYEPAVLVTAENREELGLAESYIGYYAIGNAGQLYWFADKVDNENATYGSVNVVLTKDITVNEGTVTASSTGMRDWNPIGWFLTTSDDWDAFSGTFDGNGKRVSGLYFNNEVISGVSLFAITGETALVKNVTVTNSYFCGEYNNSAVVAINLGTVSGCFNEATLIGDGQIGGIVGRNLGLVELCGNTGAITGDTRYVGGIVGENKNTVRNCWNTGNIQVRYYYAGGITGANNSVATDRTAAVTENCWSTGTVVNLTYSSAGGIVGAAWVNLGGVRNCYSLMKPVGRTWNGHPVTNVEQKTLDQFASGEVAYLLRTRAAEGTDVWGQNIDNDQNKQDVPALNGADVYQVVLDCAGSLGYSNTNASKAVHNYDDNGFCTNENAEGGLCDAFQPAVYNEEKGYYEISNAGQLYWFAGLVNGTLDGAMQNASANAILTADIDLNIGATINKDGTYESLDVLRKWTPIGSSTTPYAGVFRGVQHRISHVYINSTDDYQGLFGYVTGTVNGCTVKESYVKGKDYVGGVIGYLKSTGEILFCENLSSVNGEMYVGGVIGYAHSASLINECANDGNVVGTENVGGVIGYVSYAVEVILNCENNGRISGEECVGGVIGWGDGTIQGCTNSGIISGTRYVGGVAGSVVNGTKILNCSSMGIVSGTSRVGGVVGDTGGIVENSYNLGIVEGVASAEAQAQGINDSEDVGGIVGYLLGYVNKCYNDAPVAGYKNVGGIAGYNDGIVNQCHNIKTVEGMDSVGGIVGYNDNTVQYCFNQGNVPSVYDNQGVETRIPFSGAVVGQKDGSTELNCYYLISNTVNVSVGGINGRDSAGKAEAKTAEQFASGELTWKLNLGISDGTQAWYQTLSDSGNVKLPTLVPDKGSDATIRNAVYRSAPCGISYSNEYGVVIEHTYVNGICTACDGFMQPTQNAEGYYEIDNAGKLYWFAEYVNSKVQIAGADTPDDTTDDVYSNSANAVLTANITVNENVLSDTYELSEGTFREWTPIGKQSNIRFEGIFDGQGYTVSGLYAYFENMATSVVGATLPQGMFGMLDDYAVVKNLTLADTYFYAEYGEMGAIVGWNTGTVENCFVEALLVSQSNMLGGIVGENYGSVKGCTFAGVLKSVSYTGSALGGIVGHNAYGGKVQNCINLGDILGRNQVGGIVGSLDTNSGVVENCYNRGSLSGEKIKNYDLIIGQVIGDPKTYARQVINCYYLAGSESDTIYGTSAKTAAQFASGEVAYLLGDAFGQILDENGDKYPVFANDANKVYMLANCDGTPYIYTNDATLTITEHQAGVSAAECFDENGVCLTCGTQAAARLTTADETPVVTYYMTIEEAITAAESAENSTVTLLDNCASSINNWFTITSGSFKINFNGKKLMPKGDSNRSLSIEGGNITLFDDNEAQGGASKVVVVHEATLTIDGGIFEGVVIVDHENGTLIINNGTISQIEHVQGALTIKGGELSLLLVYKSSGKTPVDVLPKDYYFYDKNGKIINAGAIAPDLYKYQVEDFTVKKGADLSKDAVITVSDSEYNGVIQIPTVIVTVGGVTLDYGEDYSTITHGVPISAGSYTISIMGRGNYTGSANTAYTIEKATPKADDFSGAFPNGAIYDGTAKTAIIEAKSGISGMGEITVKYYDAEGNLVNGAPVNAGTYTIKIDVAEGANYKAVTDLEIGSFTIAKATPVVTPPTAIEDLIYNGELQAIATPGSTTGGTLQYAVYRGVYGGVGVPEDVWEEIIRSAPGSATETESGTYSVLYRVVGDDNYESVAMQYINVTVGKATPTLNVTSPTPSVLPGNTILLSYTLTGVKGEELTNTVAIINAKVGNLVCEIDGLKVTVHSDAVIGGEDKLVVTLRSLADGNYDDSEVFTLTLDIGMADFTAEIEELKKDIEELNKLIAENGTIDQINNKLTEIENRVKALEDNGATDAELEKAKTDLTAAYTKAIEDAVAELETKIAAQIDPTELAEAIKGVTDLIDALDDTYATDAKLAEAITKAETELATAVSVLEDKIAKEVEKLQRQITSNDTDIEDINTSITTINGLIDALGAADEALDGKITDAVNAVKSDLTTAVSTLEDKIAKEVEKLQGQITSSDTDIEDINTSITTINGLIDALGAADEALDGKITDAVNAVKSDLTTAVSTLEDKIAKEVEKLQGQITSSDTDIEDINTSITTINGLIDALKKADEALDGKISDAITKAENELKAAQDELKALIGDVQTNLDNAKTELDKAIADLDAAMKQGDADLSTEIANLNTALTNAKAALEKADADNKAELVKKIEDADATLDAAIKAVQKNLDDAKAELDTAIKNGDTALDGKISNLNAALESAKAALEKADTDNKAELEGKITEAQSTLQSAIDKVAKDLADAEKELADAIASGDAALGSRISSVSASLSEAKTALEKADADNKAELIAKIEAAEATLDAAIKAVQKNLDDAKTALEKALADGDKANADALAQAISDLNAAIDAAKTAAATADGSLKTELTSKIDNADVALQAAIDALSTELDATNEKVDQLETFIIIVCVISGVALCGSGAFVVWFFIDRKKRI